jgi:hypothetical protein
MSCEPSGTKMPPGYFAKLTDCEKLALYEEAAFTLSTGQQKTQVRYGEYWVQFGLGSTVFIQREIARLRSLCNPRSAIGIARSGGSKCQTRFR